MTLKTVDSEISVKSWGTFYIGPEETSQQTSERRESLRRSIKAAKTKIRRLAGKGSAQEQVRLQKQAVRQELHRQAETDEARKLRLQKQAVRQQCIRDEITTSETAESRQNRLQSEAQRKQASRVGSPSRSSSDSDVVMSDVLILR